MVLEWMDAGELKCITSPNRPRKQNGQKKRGSRSSPSLVLRVLLVSVLLAACKAVRRSGAAQEATTRCGNACGRARILDNQGQIAHGEVACTNVADERKAVSILEVANREHVTLEVRSQGLCRVHPDRATGDAASVTRCRRRGRRRRGSAVPGQPATAGLCTGRVGACGERIL